MRIFLTLLACIAILISGSFLAYRTDSVPEPLKPIAQKVFDPVQEHIIAFTSQETNEISAPEVEEEPARLALTTPTESETAQPTTLKPIETAEDETQEAETPTQADAPKSADAPKPAVAEKPAISTISKPEFDIVRVEKTGDTLVAGQSSPNAEVTLKNNGEPIAQTIADASGQWVIVLDKPLIDPSNTLTIEEVVDGTTTQSEQTVAVLRNFGEDNKDEVNTVVALLEPGEATRFLQKQKRENKKKQEIAKRKEAEKQQQAAKQVDEKTESKPELPSAPALAQDLETNTDAAIITGSVAVDAVEVEDGKIFIVGETASQKSARIYINDTLLGDARPSPEGRWLYEGAKILESGTYAVRVDELNNKGEVTARAEVPFTIEEENGVQSTLTDGAPKVIIRNRDNLWSISRRLYGQGERYTAIFKANQSQIRDPDLIYPGQVFELPEDGLTISP